MILVTGATGLIGSHLTLYLTRKGENLRALYRNENSIEKTRNLFALYSSQPEELFNKIEWVKADITDITSLDHTFDGISQVYHSAAFVSFDNRLKDLLQQTNVEGTANLLHLAQENNIKKFLHFSSIAVFGQYDQPITEKTHWNWKEKHSEYAVSKYLAEMEVWRASQEGLPVVILNPAVVLGAGFWNEGTGKLFEMIDKGMRYYPPGGNNFVDVWDVVKIAYELIQSPIVNDSFIAGGHHTTYKDLLTKIAASLDKKPPSRQLSYPLAMTLARLDTLKSKLTGSSPRFTPGIVGTLFENPEYSSEKLMKALNHRFIPLEASLQNIAAQYRKTRQK